MAGYLIDRYSGKEHGPAKQTSEQNKSLFWNVQVPRYNNFMDKAIFSGRGERPNGKISTPKGVSLFPVKVEHILF